MRATQLSLPLPPEPRARSRETPDEPGDHPFIVEPAPPPPPRPLPPKAEVFSLARSLAQDLSGNLGKPVRLIVTDNRSTMLSFRRRREQLVLRLHHMFLRAPEAVVRAIADYAGRGDRSSASAIDDFVRANGAAIRPPSERRGAEAPLQARGKVYDLQAIFDRVNLFQFEGRIQARIGWGRAAGRGRRRTIRMGVYDHLTKTIRIHPALDSEGVPEFFVEYIVFHEMLHQDVPGTGSGARKIHHGPAFRARERAYPDYQRALAWEREHISTLLGAPASRRARPAD